MMGNFVRLLLLKCLVCYIVSAPTKHIDKARTLLKDIAMEYDALPENMQKNERLQNTMDNVEVVHRELLEKVNSLLGNETKATHPGNKTNAKKKVNREDIVSLLKDLENDIDVLKKKLAKKMNQLRAEEKEKREDITNINIIANVEGAAKKMGVHVKDGDMLVTKEQEDIMKYDNAHKDVQRDALKNPALLWPRDPITKRFRLPIKITNEIRKNAKKMSLISAAIEQFKSRTEIDILPAKVNEHYVLIMNGQGCYSFLGRVTKIQFKECTNCQTLSIGNGCENLGTVEHEFMHALGFIHEHTRPDRDQYVRIVYSNVLTMYKSQFTKQAAARINSAGLRYDIRSIMHYGPYAFSVDYINRKPTIVLASSGQAFTTNRAGFSALDIEGINRIYPKAHTPFVLSTPAPFHASSCEFFARLSLCSYKEICSVCYDECTKGKPAQPIIKNTHPNDRSCNSWMARGLCRTNNYVKTNCVKACYRVKYPDDRKCS